MAFYPDELSPIDRFRNPGKSPDLTELILKRQWKCAVLGKKEIVGMNNFATIAEEKEEEISSEGSIKGVAMPVPVPNKRIVFPKPRKYITSRVLERKNESPRSPGGLGDELVKINLTEPPKQEVTANYLLGYSTNPAPLTGWPKFEEKKPDPKNPKATPDGKSAKKDKTLNMKDVVNVYKNLAYGSKDEIKNFVEKLSFGKDNAKTGNDKTLKNLKTLENKIKDLGKKTDNAARETIKKKKSKTGGRKMKKSHIERLARHKVVKVPATLHYTYSPDSMCLSYGSTSSADRPVARKPAEEKAPWRYVGTQSALDKGYLVYPAYPAPPLAKGKVKKSGNSKAVPPETGQKVKTSNESISRGLSRRDFRSLNTIFSGRSFNQSSATTICTVQFRPAAVELEPTDPSLLFYLHGQKAIHLRSPYLDKQFSRVKFFRREGSRVPLIRGVDRSAINRNCRHTVSVKNISLPESLSRVRFVDYLDFDEDIQNINDFLHSQEEGREESRESLREVRPEASLSRESSLSPDRIIRKISQDFRKFQDLPDTKENRRLVTDFFDEIDSRIEETKASQRYDKSCRLLFKPVGNSCVKLKV